MQDRYAFDFGDFGKLGLLRHLANVTCLPLGVLWWKTGLGSAGGDGKHIGYLSDRRFRERDPLLWGEMGSRIHGGRSIAALHSLFPAFTRFHDQPVPRRVDRQAWLQSGLAAVSLGDEKPRLLFCDPDNGVDYSLRCDSQRHIGISEVHALWAKGHSLVLYHHLNRSASHPAQIESGLATFSEALGGLTRAWGAHYRRGSSRVFFVLAQPHHAELMSTAMATFARTPWLTRGDFRVYGSSASNCPGA